MQKSYIYYILGIALLFCFGRSQRAYADDGKFVVVIDAGHGGRDHGAIGSSPSSREKDINLAIALKVGNLIKSNCSDIKLIYTRDKDFFVTLQGRADIANKAKADLFLSIHTNSVENRKTSQPVGVQAYTLTLRTAQENLEVEKRENSVLQYEADGKEVYSLANDASSESDIMFELMQDRDMQESVDFATLCQKELVNTGGRKDMGVLQANLAVLRWTYMPSVLVEVGFICSRPDEQFLLTDAGQTIIAKCLFNAVATYKARHTGRMSNMEKIGSEELQNASEQTKPVESVEQSQHVSTPVTSQDHNSVNPETQKGIQFKVQIFASQNMIKSGSPQLKGLEPQFFQENGMYKYTYGATSDYNEILRMRKDVLDKFPQSFIVAFNDGTHIETYTAIQLWKKNNK